MTAEIVCDNLVRVFRTDGVEVVALQGLDLVVDQGDLLAVVGASGSGKSTLLNILSGLDVPTAGLAQVAGRDLLTMRRADRLRYRRETVGFLWQQAERNLLPDLTALENVVLPLVLGRRPRRARRARAEELLGLLELTGVADRLPRDLTGGERQRVALAVALSAAPPVVLADEPTGDLDATTARQVFAALRAVNAELGVTVVVVTHDERVSGEVGRTVRIRDGRTSSEVLRTAGEGHDPALVAREYAVLDRVGRLQLPSEFTARLGLRGRVRLDLEDDHIGVWPQDRPEPRP